ncbi:hypothetical protein SAMN05444365_101206 [Micromonospora pattaloongensis]|uniref:Uncharacterized protein n=1 Tax=Micromonospora pattaloongensis TaxID=405436 RepID=A0A1H3FY25_9ACTN|nr:hypothetical protein SAMN05444365_101206 [Micromonospora pattaloongensis]
MGTWTVDGPQRLTFDGFAGRPVADDLDEESR